MSANPKTLSTQIIQKLTTRNILALAMVGSFIVVLMQMTFNAQALLVVLKENAEWVFAGGIIIGTLVAKLSDIIQFYFRRANPS